MDRAGIENADTKTEGEASEHPLIVEDTMNVLPAS
jgi:hypothetical protein